MKKKVLKKINEFTKTWKSENKIWMESGIISRWKSRKEMSELKKNILLYGVCDVESEVKRIEEILGLLDKETPDLTEEISKLSTACNECNKVIKLMKERNEILDEIDKFSKMCDMSKIDTLLNKLDNVEKKPGELDKKLWEAFKNLKIAERKLIDKLEKSEELKRVHKKHKKKHKQGNKSNRSTSILDANSQSAKEPSSKLPQIQPLFTNNHVQQQDSKQSTKRSSNDENVRNKHKKKHKQGNKSNRSTSILDANSQSAKEPSSKLPQIQPLSESKQNSVDNSNFQLPPPSSQTILTELTDANRDGRFNQPKERKK